MRFEKHFNMQSVFKLNDTNCPMKHFLTCHVSPDKVSGFLFHAPKDLLVNDVLLLHRPQTKQEAGFYFRERFYDVTIATQKT